jgi:exonuclease III
MVKGWEKFYQANGSSKQAGVAILISDKVVFKLNVVKRDKEGDFLLIKRAIHQEEMTIFNLYAPNASAPNFIKHTIKDLKQHIDPNIVIMVDFNTHLATIDRLFRQKIQQRNSRLKCIIDLMELTDLF